MMFWKCYGKDPESDNGYFIIIVRATSKEKALATAKDLLISAKRSGLYKTMSIQLLYADIPEADGVVVYDDVEEK